MLDFLQHSTVDTKLIVTLLMFFIAVIIHISVRKITRRLAKKNKIREERRLVLSRTISISQFTLVLILIIIMWNVAPENIWVAFTSVFGIIGVGLFAQWSFLSNTFAAVLLFYNSPFRTGDYIVVDDGALKIEGGVISMTMFYVHVETTAGNFAALPNNFLLQRAVIKLKKENIPPKVNK